MGGLKRFHSPQRLGLPFFCKSQNLSLRWEGEFRNVSLAFESKKEPALLSGPSSAGFLHSQYREKKVTHLYTHFWSNSICSKYKNRVLLGFMVKIARICLSFWYRNPLLIDFLWWIWNSRRRFSEGNERHRVNLSKQQSGLLHRAASVLSFSLRLSSSTGAVKEEGFPLGLWPCSKKLYGEKGSTPLQYSEFSWVDPQTKRFRPLFSRSTQTGCFKDSLH